MGAAESCWAHVAGACDAAEVVEPGSTAVDGFSAGPSHGRGESPNRIRDAAPQGFRFAADREYRQVWPGSGRTVAVSGSSANQSDHADPDQQDPETRQSTYPGWWAISELRRWRATDQVR